MRPHKFWVLPSLIPSPITRDTRILSNSASSFPPVVFAQSVLSSGSILPQLTFFLSSVQLLSCVWLSVTPWTAAHQASLSITISWSFLKLMSIESVMPSNHLILHSSYTPSNVGSCLFCLHLNLNVTPQKPDSSLSPRDIFYLALSAITFICPHIHCDYNFFNEIQVH